MSDIEVWKEVPGYEGFYSVSNLGRVRRDAVGQGARAGYILKATVSRPVGYLRVGLVRDGKQKTRFIHNLVANAFLGPYPDGQCVNHKDGNKLNNLPGNLEYMTLGDNNRHAWQIGILTRKSFCIAGHQLVGDNVYIHPKRLTQECRACASRRRREYKKRQQVKGLARSLKKNS